MYHPSAAVGAYGQNRGDGLLAVASPIPRAVNLVARNTRPAAASTSTALTVARIDTPPRKSLGIPKQTPPSAPALAASRGYVATRGFASPGPASRPPVRALSQPATRRSLAPSTATSPPSSMGDCEAHTPVLSGGGGGGMLGARISSRKALPLNLSRIDSDAYYPMLPSPPPHLRDRHLLLLDLDETLVHTLAVDLAVVAANTEVRRQSSVSGKDCDTHVLIAPDESGLHDSGAGVALQVRFRPHVVEFLEFVAQRFEVGVFTASRRSYADCIIDALEGMISRRKMRGRDSDNRGPRDDDEPSRVFGARRLYREHCCDLQGQKIKDLSLLGRPLGRVALVDNSSFAYHLQPRNGIPIPSWYGSPHDKELIRLMPLLQKLQHASNVVTVLDELDA